MLNFRMHQYPSFVSHFTIILTSIQSQHIGWQDQENYIREQNARIKELEAVVTTMRSEYVSFVDMQKGIIESLGVPDPLDLRQGPREGPFCLPLYFCIVTSFGD